VESVEAVEPPAALKTSFKVRGRILFSSNPENEVGQQGTANENFKYPESALARVRTFVKAMKSFKEQRQVLDSECGPEALREIAGESQPMVGVIIAVDATLKNTDPTKSGYTLYTGAVPTAEEIEHLIQIGALKQAA